MGLPVWSSIGFGDDDGSSSKPEATNAPRRSPINRRSPFRAGAIRDPQTGERRTFRRPTRAINSTDRFRVIHLHDANIGRSDLRRTQSRSPLVPTIPSELRAAFDECMNTIRDNGTSVQSMERSSMTRSPVRERDAAWLDALENALALGRGYRRDLQAWTNTVENWERIAQRGEWTHRLTPTTLITRLTSIRNDVNSAMDTVFNAFSYLYAFQDGRPRERPRHAPSFEIESPRSEGSPQPSTNLDVRPLSPGLADLSRASSELPPLRRMGHRSIIDEPIATPPVGFVAVPTPPPESSRPSISRRVGRTRSASPDNDADAWDTMLMTIEPDVSLPSADSSFTSAAASTSFSAGSSSRPSSTSDESFRTHITLPDGEETACESDEEDATNTTPRATRHRHDSAQMSARNSLSSSNAFDTRDAAEFVRAYYQSQFGTTTESIPATSFLRFRTLEPQRSGSSFGDLPRSESPAPLSRDDNLDQNESLSEELQSARAAVQAAEDFASQIFGMRSALGISHRSSGRDELRSPSSSVAPDTLSHSLSIDRFTRRSTRPGSVDPLSDPELEHMRTILERMAHSGEIPNDWWASAGLTPMIAQSTPTNGGTGLNSLFGSHAGSAGRERL